jgi:Na+/phosphate symporter
MRPEDRADLETMHGKVLRRLEASIAVLATRDRGAARLFLQDGEELERWYLAAERRHFERLKAADPAAAVSSERFLDILANLRRISGELDSIGETFAGRGAV